MALAEPLSPLVTDARLQLGGVDEAAEEIATGVQMSPALLAPARPDVPHRPLGVGLGPRDQAACVRRSSGSAGSAMRCRSWSNPWSNGARQSAEPAPVALHRETRYLVRVVQHPASALEAARLRLARLAVDEKQSLERVFARSTRLIARTLDIERVGIWLFDDRREEICCACLYERRTDTHGTGARLVLADFPRYRAALEDLRAVVANDARTDPLTSELAGSYLEPHGITSMLDAALFRHGEVAGVVCHEHVGPPRKWTEAEIGFAESVADIVAHAMEQAAHIEARKALEEFARKTELDRRMASLGRVVAAVAHDFSNLLMIVQVRAEQITALDNVAPAAVDYARVILDTVRRSRELTRQLAELGRGPEEPPQELVLDEVVGAADDLLHAMARDGRQVVLTLGAPGARVSLDRPSLERLLANLVLNALEASPPGEPVNVSTTTVNGEDRSYVVLRVADRGHGIDEDTRPLIFEPYFSTRRKVGGCGLGLAIVHVTAQRAGGFIDVESAPGEGTTVAVHLPVVTG